MVHFVSPPPLLVAITLSLRHFDIYFREFVQLRGSYDHRSLLFKTSNNIYRVLKMLIKEYRIPLPLSVEEYRVAQLYMIAVSCFLISIGRLTNCS